MGGQRYNLYNHLEDSCAIELPVRALSLQTAKIRAKSLQQYLMGGGSLHC